MATGVAATNPNPNPDLDPDPDPDLRCGCGSLTLNPDPDNNPDPNPKQEQHRGATPSKRGLTASSRDDEGARKGMRLSPPSRLHCLQNSAPLPPPAYFRAPPPPYFAQQRDVCLGDGMCRRMVKVPQSAPLAAPQLGSCTSSGRA